MSNIITNIKYGWCDFDLEGFHGKPSYIRFVPMDILNAYEEYIKLKHYIIEFDEELTQFTLVGFDKNVWLYTNQDNDEYKIYKLDISAENLIQRLANEVSKNVRVWSEWCALGTDEDSIKNIERIINNKIKTISDLKLSNKLL